MAGKGLTMKCDSGINSTVKHVLSGHSKRRPKISFQDRLSLNAGQKYCRMLQNASTFIKLPFVFKTFVFSIFEWPLKTGFTVQFIASYRSMISMYDGPQ